MRIPPTTPPSTFKIVPVHQLPALLLKKTTGPTISSSPPSRPNGAISANLFASFPNPADMRVGTNPGAMQFTVIPLGAKSADSFLVRWWIAALLVSYAWVGACTRKKVSEAKQVSEERSDKGRVRGIRFAMTRSDNEERQ